MSEVRLVVREMRRDWSGTIHGSCADRAIAALSADPTTMEELELATARFAACEPGGRFYGNLRSGHSAEPYDAGLVVIDLVARLVVVDSTYSSPGSDGTVCYHNGRCGTQQSIRYHLADDWVFLSDGDHWAHVAESQRRDRAAKPIRDAREVFYGRPLVEFVARQCFAAFARRTEIAAAVRAERAENARKRLADEANFEPDDIDNAAPTDDEMTPETWPGSGRSASPFYDVLKDIHAAWLLTPRDDLGGACPREVALERSHHISRDLEDRREQWSRFDECPRGLEKSAHAFRFGGFGTHELVMYYDLVRALLWSCWEQLTERADAPGLASFPESFTVGDFLATEVPRLEKMCERLLDTPDRELRGRTPRSIIERERARLPEIMSRHEVIVDPDCPCCQMLGEMPGPTFWHLDGSSMDNEFAFDMHHRNREQWEAEQRSWDELSERLDAERVERRRLGLADSASN